MSKILQVRGLSAGYGKALVLENLSLEAHVGTIVSVLGPNGAGKSTLLNSLGGVLRSKGIVLFEGEDVSALPVEQRLMRGIALVPERRELFGTMTVEENLLLGGYRPRSMGDLTWRNGLENVYDLFPRLLERRKQRANTMSGGERQMLAVGRALMSKPKLLLLDEPSLGLAPLIVADIMAAIMRLSRDGLSVLLVEQNARAALAISRYGYVLETGKFAVEGEAAQLMHDERLISTYLGAESPQTAGAVFSG
ncbi:ATP-binding cassette domain-containing protein [Variovorax paradoxus]|uniref:ATP-binding cassette domain-containing protein n=1 Tax=Variovorax paradoxus TaxID=34073 RepID=A0A5Q0M5Y5_VARPD|nr:ABC transporter ATP-binding protein [Variovorax paradoxus]QFZ85170.1 ATP-binding cassette domain-containing protein [Variovorax paradoxus]